MKAEAEIYGKVLGRSDTSCQGAKKQKFVGRNLPVAKKKDKEAEESRDGRRDSTVQPVGAREEKHANAACVRTKKKKIRN